MAKVVYFRSASFWSSTEDRSKEYSLKAWFYRGISIRHRFLRLWFVQILIGPWLGWRRTRYRIRIRLREFFVNFKVKVIIYRLVERIVWYGGYSHCLLGIYRSLFEIGRGVSGFPFVF